MRLQVSLSVPQNMQYKIILNKYIELDNDYKKMNLYQYFNTIYIPNSQFVH